MNKFILLQRCQKALEELWNNDPVTDGNGNLLADDERNFTNEHLELLGDLQNYFDQTIDI